MNKRILNMSVIFIAALMIANVTAFKTFTLGPFTMPAGVFLFPITYILGDVFAEVYGFKTARHIAILGFVVNLMAAGYYTLAIALPPTSFFGTEAQMAYSSVLGSTPRILIASLAAYLCGSLLNAKIVHKMHARDGESRLWRRLMLSTVVGEFIDSTIFISIAFIGTMPGEALILMICTQAVFKIIIEALIYPITRKIINKERMKVL